MARVLYVNDNLYPGILEGFLGNGHQVVYIPTLTRGAQARAVGELECYTPATDCMQRYTYHIKSWGELTDDELQSSYAVFVDGRLVGWRIPGADADLTGADLTRELRDRGYAGKIFANSGNPNLNRSMIEVGADGIADSETPFKSLDTLLEHTTPSHCSI